MDTTQTLETLRHAETAAEVEAKAVGGKSKMIATGCSGGKKSGKAKGAASVKGGSTLTVQPIVANLGAAKEGGGAEGGAKGGDDKEDFDFDNMGEDGDEEEWRDEL